MGADFRPDILCIEGDGLLTLILAVIVLPLVYFRWNEKTAGVTAVVELLIAFIALLSVTGISAMGVYITLLGGLTLLGSAVQGFRKL